MPASGDSDIACAVFNHRQDVSLPRSQPHNRRSPQKPASLIEACLADPRFEQQFNRQIDPELREVWRAAITNSVREREDAHQELYRGLAAARRSATWAGVLAPIVLMSFIVLSVVAPLPVDSLLAVMPAAPAQLTSHFGSAGIGVLGALLCGAWRESNLRRARVYESQLAFTSSINVALSAAVTLGCATSIDRAIDAFVVAQRCGLLSVRTAAAMPESAGTRRNLNFIARGIRRLFLK